MWILKPYIGYKFAHREHIEITEGRAPKDVGSQWNISPDIISVSLLS
jgi:hypothetical protein